MVVQPKSFNYGVDIAIKEIQKIMDSHKRDAKGECTHGCDFVVAWETAIEHLEHLRLSE